MCLDTDTCKTMYLDFVLYNKKSLKKLPQNLEFSLKLNVLHSSLTYMEKYKSERKKK